MNWDLLAPMLAIVGILAVVTVADRTAGRHRRLAVLMALAAGLLIGAWLNR